MRKFILFSFFIKFITCTTDDNHRWFCNKQSRCVITQEDTDSNGSLTYETQNICRLSCGRYGSLWPKPTGATLISSGRLNFDPENIRFDLTNTYGQVKKMFSEITFIFVDSIMKECNNNCSFPGSSQVLIRISVNSSKIIHTWDTDESYSLVITPSDSLILIKISSATIYGSRHALETVSQLITSPEKSGSGLVMVSAARVKDRPAYKHRGFLLDTSRNFIPLNYIERTLAAMASCKMNIFHWHATDSHSFPLEITRVPEMQRYGAYSAENTYSTEEIKYIIKYARDRGIRTIIEIDAPSHSGNGWQWGPSAGLGDLAVCVNKQPWRKYCIQPPCGQLNPVNPSVYAILKEIYEELAEVLPDEEVMHMGGDEVHFGCWNSTEEILHALEMQGLDTSTNSFLKLWGEFQEKNLLAWDKVKGRSGKNSLRGLSSNVIVWSSHLTEPEFIRKYLPPNRYIIQTWVESSNPLVNQLLELGYRIIASTKDAWYLDHGFWGKTQYYDWKTVYNNRLQKTPGILGGEACMWSEYVDENSLESRVWPRTGAVAERLWADPETDAVQAESRFFRFRERLISRGLHPDAITPKWCTQHEGNCL